MANPRIMPGIPAMENLEWVDRLYTMKSIRGSDVREELVMIPEASTIDIVIERCRKICSDEGRRFIWVAKAIRRIVD